MRGTEHVGNNSEMPVSTDPNDPNFGLETDPTSPDFGLAPQQPPPQQPARIPSAYIPPEVAKEVTQQFDVQHPVLGAAAQALGETVSGFIPQTIGQGAQMFAQPLTGAVEQIGKTGLSLRDVLFGGQTPTQAMETNFPEAFALREAEKTPPFSKERFAAGFGTVANLGMAAAIGRSIPLSEMLFPTKEVAPLTQATESVVRPPPIPEQYQGKFTLVPEPKPEIAPVNIPIEQQVAGLKTGREVAPLPESTFGISQSAENARRAELAQGAPVPQPEQPAPVSEAVASTTQTPIEAGTFGSEVRKLGGTIVQGGRHLADIEGTRVSLGNNNKFLTIFNKDGTQTRIPATVENLASLSKKPLPQIPTVTEPTTAQPLAKTVPPEANLRTGIQPETARIGEPNASQIESTTPPNGGVRTRSELGELPQGNVETANARLRGNAREVPAETRQGTEAQPQKVNELVTPPEGQPIPGGLKPAYKTETGNVYSSEGATHSEALDQAFAKEPGHENGEIGFVDKNGNFLNRQQAHEVAVSQTSDVPQVSRIANRFTQERAAQGEIGEIVPGQGYSTQELVQRGLKMGPEEINQHVSDLMQGTGDIVKQGQAVRAEEARLSQRSAELSRVSDANPNDVNAKLASDNAFKDLTDFHNGPVAQLKNKWHATGMEMQGEIPVDLSTYNGLREAWLRDTGELPPRRVESTLRETAQKVSKSIEEDNGARSALSNAIEKQSASRKLPSYDEVRNNIRQRMGLEPCPT